VGNLLGGIAMQTLVLVLLDFTSRRKRPLTSLATDANPLLESMLVIALVTIALMGGYLPETTAIGSVSPASIAIVVFFLLGIMGLNRARRQRAWMIAGDTPAPAGGEAPNRFKGSSTKVVLGVFGLASVITLFAGVMLEQTGNQLADDFGINGVIFGATILAAVTALPEISSGIAAVRLGQVGLAMSDIYGGNAMQLTFFLLADLLAGSPVLPTASAQSLWLGATGALVTAIFAYGLLVRNEKKVIGLGRDSLLVLLTYIAAVSLLTAVPG
jgi:cation:H+ antiporter